MEEKDKGYFHEARYIDQEGQSRTTKVPVVQELARQGLNLLPKRFIRQPSKNPIEPDVSNDLPLISVAKLRLGSDPEIRAQELAKLAIVVKEWGLFLIEDHNISSCVLDEVKKVVKGFFNLSFEEKKRSVGTYASVDNMGYGRNFVKSEDQTLDWIDRLSMKAAPIGSDEGLHVWPLNPPNFREVIEKYVIEGRNELDELLQALAEALSLERHVFQKHFDPNNSEINIRVNYYPPCPRPDLTLGITPHTDAGGLTLLMQFDASRGLQILKDQKWVTVPWPNDVLLVNLGDLLEIMSNGRLKSSWHRVVTQVDVERFSVVLFYHPPSHTEIEPEPVEDGAAMEGGGFRKVVVGHYLQHYYKVNPSDEKIAITYAKV